MTTPAPPATEAPNLFNLTGDHLSVTLALSGIDGRPHFNYHDGFRALNFTGDEITLEDTAMGKQATVTIVRTVDAGDTSFTLRIPVVNLLSGQHTITTLGITTMHRTTIAGIGRGQLTTYNATPLHGSATQVDF